MADRTNDRIQVFAPSGEFVREWGGGSDPAQLHEPRGVAVGPDGNIYVTDTAAFEVNVYTQTGVFLRSWGNFGREPGEFSDPDGIAADDSGNVYVADPGNGRIQKFTAEGVFLKAWPAGSNGTLGWARGVAVDDFGHLYAMVIDQLKVVKFTTQGDEVGSFGDPPILDSGNYVTTDPQGNVYVTDSDHFRVVKFSPEGKVLSTWGPGTGAACAFAEVTGIAVDANGNVYVMDEGNIFSPVSTRPTCIQKFSYGVTPTRRLTWGELKVRYR